MKAFAELFRHVAGDARGMLTVIASDAGPYKALALPLGVRVDRDDETLMTTTFAPIDAPALGPEFVARWDIDEHRARYVLESGERVAAEGTIGILGDDAAFDAVETTPAFKRRGLGRHVMAVLTAYAFQSGVRRGLLAASAEGRLLYESLGPCVRDALADGCPARSEGVRSRSRFDGRPRPMASAPCQSVPGRRCRPGRTAPSTGTTTGAAPARSARPTTSDKNPGFGTALTPDRGLANADKHIGDGLLSRTRGLLGTCQIRPSAASSRAAAIRTRAVSSTSV